MQWNGVFNIETNIIDTNYEHTRNRMQKVAHDLRQKTLEWTLHVPITNEENNNNRNKEKQEGASIRPRQESIKSKVKNQVSLRCQKCAKFIAK